MSIIHRKESWFWFLGKALLLTLILLATFTWVESRFRIGIDGQAIRCLPDHKYYLVDLKQKEAQRDDIIAYRSQGLTPYFADDTMMAKIISGMPGDHIQVNAEGVFINGQQIANGFPLIERLSVSEESLYRDEVIPDGKYLLLAPAPESYDGRYWGYINADQIIGKAIPLL